MSYKSINVLTIESNRILCDHKSIKKKKKRKIWGCNWTYRLFILEFDIRLSIGFKYNLLKPNTYLEIVIYCDFYESGV